MTTLQETAAVITEANKAAKEALEALAVEYTDGRQAVQEARDSAVQALNAFDHAYNARRETIEQEKRETLKAAGVSEYY